MYGGTWPEAIPIRFMVSHLGCVIRIRGHSASGTNTNTNAMSKDECANGEVAVTLGFFNMPTLF